MDIKVYKTMPDEAMEIRRTVFVAEQGFCDEFDAIDGIAAHVLAYDGERGVGCCRIFSADDGKGCIIGRLAVLAEHRGRGIGSGILSAAEEYAKSEGFSYVKLHSQYRASGFYAKNGYFEDGGIEDEQGCPHVWMKKELI